MTPKFRSAYDGLRVSDGDVDFSKTVSLTKQADLAASDINNILANYQRTGLLPELIKADPQYGDFSDVASFQEAFEIVAHAETQFAALDAHVRQRFDNDPAKFLAFAEEPKNRSELVKMGLASAVNADGSPLAPTPQPASPEPSRRRAGASQPVPDSDPDA